MRFLAGLALFFLGLHLVAEALWAWKGRWGLLARVLGSPFWGLLYGLLLRALSGSGSGLGLLALALLEVGVLTRLDKLAAALGGERALAQEVLREPGEAFFEGLRRAHLARLEAGLAESRASTLAHLDILLTLEEVDQGLARLAGLALEL